MWPLFGSLSVVPWILFAQMSWSMDAVPVHAATRPLSGAGAVIRDRAGLFGRSAGRRAREALGPIHRNHRIPVLIETITSLDGAGIADAARRRARSANPEQLHILLAGADREVEVIAARRGPASRLSDQQREAIRRAFLGPLRMGETDRALEQGVQAIETAMAAASGPRSGAGRALVPVTIVLAALAPLAAARLRGWVRRLRRASARTITGGQDDRSLFCCPRASQIRPPVSPSDFVLPFPVALSSGRYGEKVGP